MMVLPIMLTSSSVLAGNDKKEGVCGICSINKNGPKAYVMAGAVGLQNGSKNHPFATLNQAQSGNYKTIYVLHSPQALHGGIVLKDGQSLVGVPNSLTGEYPVIENSVNPAISDPNGTLGNGVLVSGGDVCIEKIHFDNTWASAINYDNAKNIDVKNTDVTRFDKGLVVVDMVPNTLPRNKKIEIGALEAKIANNGNTRLCNLDISNSAGYSGIGISESPFASAKRKIDIRESTIHKLVSSLSEDAIPGFFPGFFNDTLGIVVYGTANTDVNVNISNSVIKDFLGPSVGSRESSRAVIINSDLGNMKVNIDSVKMYNIADPTGRIPSLALTIGVGSFDVGDSTQKAVINNSEIINTPNVGGSGVLLVAQNGVGDFKLSRNTVSGFDNGIVTISAGLSQDSYELEKNTVAGVVDSLIILSAASQGPIFNPPDQIGSLFLRPTTTFSVHDNNFIYDSVIAGSGISIVPQFTNPPDNNFPPVPVSWESLVVNAYKNCLVGGPSTLGNAGLVASLAIPVIAVPSGSITVNAHNNNITGFFANILDLNVGVQFNVENNWWGGANPVQIVANPALVSFTPTLADPIICPQNTGAHIED